MDHNSCIYKIENLINGKIYVGQTVDFQNRKNSHLSALRNNLCSNHHLQSSFNKYGESAFVFSVIEYCDRSVLNEREEYWILKLGSCFNGYNMNIGGGGRRGFHHSEDTKRKISEANKGKVFSEATRKKLRENHADFSGANSPFFGVKWADRFSEERQKEIKAKMSAANSGCKNPNYGKPMSDEQKMKLSQSQKERFRLYGNPLKGRKRPELSGENSYRAHKTVCLNTGEVFGTVNQAAEKYGLNQSGISSCCSGAKATNGRMSDGTPLVWRYYEDVSGLSELDMKQLSLDIIDKAMAHKSKKLSKPVLCVTTGEIFQSRKDACAKYGIDPSALSGYLRKTKPGRGCGRDPLTGELLVWENL